MMMTKKSLSKAMKNKNKNIPSQQKEELRPDSSNKSRSTREINEDKDLTKNFR